MSASQGVHILDRQIGSYSYGAVRQEVSLSAFSFLLSEMIQHAQGRVTSIDALERRLETAGFSVGLRLLELQSLYEKLQTKRKIKLLQVVQWISTDFWKQMFGKTADSLERSTENIDEYMIHEIQPITNIYISVPPDLGQLNCAAYVAGIIAGLLEGVNFTATVTAHTVEGDMIRSKSKTVFLVKFSHEIRTSLQFENFQPLDHIFREALFFFNVDATNVRNEEDLVQVLKEASDASLRFDHFLTSWTDHFGTSLLWYAAHDGYSLVSQLLLEKGADPIGTKKIRGNKNEALKADATPLMEAIYTYNLQIAHQMLEHLKFFGIEITPELAGMGMVEIVLQSKSLAQETLASLAVDSLIHLVGKGINQPIRLLKGSGSEFSVLSHASADANLVPLVSRLLQEEQVTGHGAAFLIAAQCGNLETVETFINTSTEIVREEFSKALIALCLADPENVFDTAVLLLKSGASPLYRIQNEKSAVSVAYKKGSGRYRYSSLRLTSTNTFPGQKNLLELFLLHGGDPLDGFLSLDGISEDENIRVCIEVLFAHLSKSGSYWVDRRINGKPIVTMLAIQCPGTYVQMAIEKGANIELLDNSFEAEYRTPLDWACRMNNISAVQVLLENGADLNRLNTTDGWTAFHTAVKHGSKELIELILKYHVDANVQMECEQHRGCTCLHLGVLRGSKAIMALLLDAFDVNINIVRANNATALMDAVISACMDKKEELSDIVSLLLEHGANPNIPDDSMNSPLIYATESLEVDLVRNLVEHGANLDFENENGDSPLSIAVENLAHENGKEIMSLMVRSQTSAIFKPELVTVLQDKVKTLLLSGNNLTVAALGWEMLDSYEARKLITDMPSLWTVRDRASHKTLNHCWAEEIESCTLYPENMLTWAISTCDTAVKILLESQHSDVKLPIEWKSNLCINLTTAGSPLRCAVDEENILALESIMNVLKPAWNFFYPVKTKQRYGDHPLDRFNHYDFLYVISAYPALMADFLKEAHLVPAYSWVSGVKRAPIENRTIWVSLTKSRSPVGIWKNYINRNRKFEYLKRPWHKTDLIFSHPHLRESVDHTDQNSVQHFFDSDDSTEASNAECSSDDHFIVSRVYDKVRMMIEIRMRKMLYSRSFSYDFDVDPVFGVRDMVPLISDISFIERDVEAFLVPVQHFATYDMLFSCVDASYKLGNPSLFDSQVMAAAVQLHWRLYGFRIHIYNLMLYVGLFAAFLALIFIYPDFVEYGGLAKIFVYFLQTYKVLYSLYFILLEFLQLRHDGNFWKYLKDPWNLLDLPAYMFLLTGVLLQSMDSRSKLAAGFHGITCLLLWFKLLYFMRPFCSYGPMVYMIFQVIYDIKIFLSILMIVMVGFGNAFFIIMGGQYGGDSCDGEDPLLVKLCDNTIGNPAPFNNIFLALRSSVSYTLGNYELNDLDEGLYPVLLSVIWVIFMFIVAIILLNLLIAIISGSYNRVSSNKVPAWRLEQARIICNIYAEMSHRERKKLNNLMMEYPWLQVLAPKKLSSDTDQYHSQKSS